MPRRVGWGVWLVQLAWIVVLEVVAQVGSAETDDFDGGLGVLEIVNYRGESLKAYA